jgi:hypothetical protein
MNASVEVEGCGGMLDVSEGQRRMEEWKGRGDDD